MEWGGPSTAWGSMFRWSLLSVKQTKRSVGEMLMALEVRSTRFERHEHFPLALVISQTLATTVAAKITEP